LFRVGLFSLVIIVIYHDQEVLQYIALTCDARARSVNFVVVVVAFGIIICDGFVCVQKRAKKKTFNDDDDVVVVDFGCCCL
jgi:hypothetical protein